MLPLVMRLFYPWGNRHKERDGCQSYPPRQLRRGEIFGGHNSYPINLKTGKQDYANGATIHPKHVHLALRKYLGLHSNSLSSLYPFNNTEEFAFLTYKPV